MKILVHLGGVSVLICRNPTKYQVSTIGC